MGSTKSKEVGPVQCETTERHQQVALDLDTHAYRKLESLLGDASTNSIFHTFPRRCRSKRRAVRKEMTKFVNSGNKTKGITGEQPSENHFSTCRRAPRKRRSKPLTDSSDSDVFVPRFRVRGQRRGPVDSCNSITQKGKLDSRTFEACMEHLWSGFSEEKRNSFTYLDSLWFSLYKQNSYKDKVLNWIKRKGIFSKDYVFVPIVIWSHWTLLILCHLGESTQSKSRTPCMLLLDSLQKTHPKRLEPGIRKLIVDMYNVEERTGNKESIHEIPLLVPKVPQQRNGEECGIYVLYYISLFLENAPDDFRISEGYPYFMKEDWFTLEELDNFCKTLELDSITKDTSRDG